MAKIEMFYKKPHWNKPVCVYRDETLSDSDAEHKFYEFRGKDTWCNPFRERKAYDYYFLCVVTYGKKRNCERCDFGGYFDPVGYEAVHEMYKTFGKMFNTPEGKSLYKKHRIKWGIRRAFVKIAFLVFAFSFAYFFANFKEIAHKIDVRLGIEKEVVHEPVETNIETYYDKPDSTWCGELNGDYRTCRKHFKKMMKKWYGENKYTLSNFDNVYYEIRGNNLYLYSYSLGHGADRVLLLYKLYPYITDCDFETVYASAYYNGGENYAVMYERGDVRPSMSDKTDYSSYPKSKTDPNTAWRVIKMLLWQPYAEEQERLEEEHRIAEFKWLDSISVAHDAYKAQYRKDFLAHKDSLYKKHNIKY